MKRYFFKGNIILHTVLNIVPVGHGRSDEKGSRVSSYIGKVRDALHITLSGLGKLGSAGALSLVMITAHAQEVAQILEPSFDHPTPRENKPSLDLKFSQTLSMDTTHPDGISKQTRAIGSHSHDNPEISIGKWEDSLQSIEKRKQDSGKTPKHRIEGNTSGSVMKQVSPEHFEETLMSFIGTRYQKGISDCSGIIQMAMRSLGVIGMNSLIGSSSDIINRLTVDKRRPTEARSGDFFYWVPRKAPGTKHIAYVSSVETSGIWIIDSSTDFNATTKRFLSWQTVLRKKGAVVGAAKFLK